MITVDTLKQVFPFTLEEEAQINSALEKYSHFSVIGTLWRAVFGGPKTGAIKMLKEHTVTYLRPQVRLNEADLQEASGAIANQFWDMALSLRCMCGGDAALAPIKFDQWASRDLGQVEPKGLLDFVIKGINENGSETPDHAAENV